MLVLFSYPTGDSPPPSRRHWKCWSFREVREGESIKNLGPDTAKTLPIKASGLQVLPFSAVTSLGHVWADLELLEKCSLIFMGRKDMT